MQISQFISSLSLEAQALLAISILWLAGFLMSRVSKIFSLPNVTGYILAGVAIGPYGLNLIPPDIASHMSFVTDAALALIAFGVGRYLRLETLRNEGKRVILLTFMEAMTAAVLVTVLMLTVFRLPLSTSLLLGAIGSATAPASSLMTIRQYHAKGPFVNTLIQVVALDDAVALMAFSVSAAIAASTEGTASGWQQMVLPLAQNLGVLLVSYILGRLLCVALRGRSPDHRIVLTCAFIFAIAGGCAMLNVSPLLGCMMLGATYINVTDDKALFKQVNRVSPPISMLFFVLSGMRLNIGALQTVGIIGVSYFAIRIIGKYLGAFLGCRLIKSPPEVQKYLGLALIPQAGVSIGLAVLAQRILPPESGMLINTIILSSSVLYEMIGPMSAKYALVHSGAIHPDALPEPLPSVKMSSTKTGGAKKSAVMEPVQVQNASPAKKGEAGTRTAVPENREQKKADSGKDGKKGKEKKKREKKQKAKKDKEIDKAAKNRAEEKEEKPLRGGKPVLRLLDPEPQADTGRLHRLFLLSKSQDTADTRSLEDAT